MPINWNNDDRGKNNVSFDKEGTKIKHTLAVVWVIGKHKQEKKEKQSLCRQNSMLSLSLCWTRLIDWTKMLLEPNSIRLTLLTAVSRLITKSYVEQLVAFGSCVKPTRHIMCVRLLVVKMDITNYTWSKRKIRCDNRSSVGKCNRYSVALIIKCSALTLTLT